ncbi:thiamine/thiamine pyrophosphate ABC transporter permease ThiP [Pseudorhodobacter turbinis]|uniref:Thiamine/thiamine pyrophosphate ABC transporter permease ThiP n=1 Tax=Pseudorhodobacter turbinis TaxID=2500533 RepID=A0A4P8EGA1_9RHOB|nr:thiamine/thiamine pyrophosphate ABC transporter permease ThiP [Pseudorhodobacter turbinis]QCO56180.1 thiamine/thiamine pyrophosphate ABC transporter permease ThiP [Pseudorhodobacter turbinis]
MAERALSLTAAGLAAAVILLLLAPLGALGLSLNSFSLSGAELAALRFTLWQAFLSAGLSIVLAIPVARALARRRFFGRGLLIATLGAPFILPVIVAVLGLLAVFGRAGWVNTLLGGFGVPTFSIYGLSGVVLAHVFFNMPLAVRMILHGWQAIPAERFRLAASLGFSPSATQRHIEVPMLREVVPGAALVIFVICLTSFAVALTLGGGPRATTIELAIYQALRFDFDLPTAARLALLQFGLCAVAYGVATRISLPSGFGVGAGREGGPPAPAGWHRTVDAMAITLAAMFLALPLLAVVLNGLPGLATLPPQVWAAALRSILIALGSTALSIAAALVLAMAAARGKAWPALAATLPLAASSLVLGTGLFLILQPYFRPASLALPVTFIINAALSLPFAFRILAPEARSLYADFHRLSASLGLTVWGRLRWVVLPRLARPLGFAAGLVAALSMGDLGVIALFAGEEEATLPLLVQRLMGAYRMEAAASAALLLVALSFALFWAFDHWGRRYAAS